MRMSAESKDDNGISFGDLVEQGDHIGVCHAHTSSGNGSANAIFVIGAVDIDVPGQTVDARAAVDPLFQTVKGQEADLDVSFGDVLKVLDFAAEAHVEALKAYILRQNEHHRHETFQDEFRQLCRKYGLAIDERYVWD